MQNNQMIYLAIMGIGTIGKRHLMAINTIENLNLCGIVDLTEEARSFCNDNKISFPDTDKEELFYDHYNYEPDEQEIGITNMLLI